MSAAVAQILLLVQHFASILTTFGANAVPVATNALKFLDVAESFMPFLTPYVSPIQLALTLIVKNGPEIAADLDKVLQLLASVEGLKPKLDAAAATTALTSSVSG